jgi:simple sugar transport system ATP-binding protein/ribose transport system ATP-binding protein
VTAPTPHAELRGITKRFGATLAVDGVDLAIQGGSVHALVGENGAGKSTLGKILAGVHVPDAGELLLEGEPVSFRSPRQALERGVTIIAQELSLVPTRDVVDNVYLGMEDRNGPVLDRRRMRRRLVVLMEETGIEVPPDAVVGGLSVAQQQQVEILRALAREARFIVMDEPSARLSAVEVEALHGVVRSLAARGRTVVYVSHFLEEVLALSDVVTVMRDGRLVKTSTAATETAQSLVVAMVGRTLEANFPDRRPPEPDAPSALRVVGLGRAGVFHDVSLDVRAGEIVGLAGLVGSGRTEVARAIFGVDPRETGDVLVEGREIPAGDVRRTIRAGVAMIPESRKDQGLLLGRPVRENVSLAYLSRLSRLGVVRRRLERTRTRELADAVDVRRASDEQPVVSLSGGNQQKVLFARWLMERPRVLIADEPTSGVDVAAKRAIYDLIADLAGQGTAVLMISSELEEVLGVAHRILVMRKGTIVAEFPAEKATEHAIVEAAFGTQEENAA